MKYFNNAINLIHLLGCEEHAFLFALVSEFSCKYNDRNGIQLYLQFLLWG